LGGAYFHFVCLVDHGVTFKHSEVALNHHLLFP
jgi:hypothetical protein